MPTADQKRIAHDRARPRLMELWWALQPLKSVVRFMQTGAHPDDETLGAGGTLLKHNNEGDEINWLIVTDVFEEQGFSKERVISRKLEIEKVSKMYGFSNVFKLGHPTMKLNDTILHKIIGQISKIFQDIKL